MRAISPMTLACLLALRLNPLHGGSPQIEFDRMAYDFGKKTGVQVVRGTFIYKNTGEATLRLGKITSSCGCIEASAAPDTLEAGEAGKLTFQVNMTSRRSLIKSHIYVASNDPTNSKVDLMVTVDYVPMFEVEPPLVRLELRLGHLTNTSVRIRRTDGKPLGVVKLESSRPWLKAALAPEAEWGATEARVLIDAKPDGLPRYYTELVRVFAGQQEQPAVTAMLVGKIRGDVQVTPETLVWNLKGFGSMPREAQRRDSLSRRVRITSSAQPLTVTNATSTVPDLRLELLPDQQKGDYTLVANLENVPKENLRGTISFETNVGTDPTVQIPVVINVPREAKGKP